MINNPTFRPFRDYWIDVDEFDVHVTYYSPYSPMVITGSGFGDAIPPDPEEIEYKVYNEHGFMLYDYDLSHEDVENIENAIREYEEDEY